MDESLTRFAGMRYFTIFDLRSGYWQIPLAAADRAKTAFTSRYGHYQWRVLPFGLTNAPAAFQRRMYRVLQQFIDKFCCVYLDDIIIFSKTHEEHERHVKKILKALAAVNMILNIDKCKFFQLEVCFLGHVVWCDGIRPDPQRISKILDWPTSQNITELCRFNSLVSGYNQYAHLLAETMRPLTDLQKGSSAKHAAIV